ncbi:hypothetical protein FWK35_00013111 [Aphis craccivora]|uniref:Uncharacterized protein n=1 Tax=Aphis craccivora TaxID=307492 RepID=A0A6G0YK01_APHCR|nr:hypothetical protein FWK35_00013111 [Aphis craccivora]
MIHVVVRPRRFPPKIRSRTEFISILALIEPDRRRFMRFAILRFRRCIILNSQLPYFAELSLARPSLVIDYV